MSDRPSNLLKHFLLVTRGETIQVNAILHVVLECIAIYCHIVIFDWILLKDILYGNMGFGSKEKNIQPV